METQFVKIVVFVPESHADKIRETLGNAGTGKIGNYSFCSFSVKGIGRFQPIGGARPAIGSVGKLEEVQEERIEVMCPRSQMEAALDAIRKAHPYEEPATDIYPIETIS